MIVLDKNYRIETDNYIFSLKFEEPFISKDKDGNEKQSLRKDEWHFPKIEMALNKYVDESLKPEQSILAVLLKLDELKEIIKSVNLNERGC